MLYIYKFVQLVEISIKLYHYTEMFVSILDAMKVAFGL